MSSSGWNPHKKGEHIFNDIVGSLENAFASALNTDQAKSTMLNARHGNLSLYDLPHTASRLSQFRNDQILTQARSVVAPATGAHSDANSRSYSTAKLKLEQILGNIVAGTADLMWRKKPRANSSFREFESIVMGIKNSSTLRNEAKAAFSSLIDSAHDPQAETSALSERVSETELNRRRAAIESMKQHRSALIHAGSSLIDVFCDEIERALARRIGAP